MELSLFWAETESFFNLNRMGLAINPACFCLQACPSEHTPCRHNFQYFNIMKYNFPVEVGAVRLHMSYF